MRILFLNPPSEYTVSENAKTVDDAGIVEASDFGLFPPLGLLYILTYLEENSSGHTFFFKDCVAEKITHKTLGSVIEKINPDVIGITSFTTALVDVVYAARTTRKIVPDAHICLGGHHPIAFPFEAAQLKEFDSIIVGEGEIAFTELVSALENDKDFTSIKGVYTEESIKQFIGTAEKDKRFLSTVIVPPAYIDDINTLPTPNRKYIDHINYHSIVGVTGKLATMISSRGCPYLCTFCDVPYKKYRERTPQQIVDEVEECLALGYTEIHFYDDLFNISPQKVIDFCDEIELRKIKFIWNFRGRVNRVDFESLKRGKRAGLRQISFGIETGSDAGLKALRKGAKIEQAWNSIRWCRQLGIRTIADFMIGLPFEKTADDVRANLDFIIKLNPDYLQLNILTLYPNTQEFDVAAEKGLIDPQRWKDFVIDPQPGFKCDYFEEYLSGDELVKLHQEGYKGFYLRPSYIIKSALQTRTFHEFSSKVKGFFKMLSST